MTMIPEPPPGSQPVPGREHPSSGNPVPDEADQLNDPLEGDDETTTPEGEQDPDDQQTG